jgi:predicted dehydrogenase
MLKVASVGLGWWSDELAKALQGKTNKLIIVGGTARTSAKRAAFAERFGARPYDSYEAVLRDPEIDGVILTTPHSLHAEHVIAAAKAGKHVFVEKPFTLTAASAARAAEACAKAGVVLAVGHNRRFAPAAVELKRMVDSGAFGTILHAETNFSAPSALSYTPERWRASRVESPAGGLAGLGIHMIDALIWLLGPVRRLVCQARRRAVQVDIDDTTSALLQFEAGYTGYLGTQCAAPLTAWLRVLGTEANAEARADFSQLEVQRSGSNPQQVSLPAIDTLRAELEAFADACAGGRPFPVRSEEAIHSVAVMEAMGRSAARGGAWLDVEPAKAKRPPLKSKHTRRTAVGASQSRPPGTRQSGARTRMRPSRRRSG